MWKKREKKAIEKENQKIAEMFDGIEGENILYLVQYSENQYIIFVDLEYDMDWQVERGFDISNPEIHKILMKINMLRHNTCVLQLSKVHRLHFNCLLGDALALAFDREFKKGEEVVEEAHAYLKNRECEITRTWLVRYTLSLFLGILILYLAYMIGSKANDIQHKNVNILVFCMLWGSMGGIFSILQHAGNIQYTCSAGKGLIICEIISRLTISVFSAIIVMKAYDIGLIFANLAQSDGNDSVRELLCIAAGFSERLAPSLIEKLEVTKEIKNDD